MDKLRELEKEVLEELKDRLEEHAELDYDNELVITCDEYDLFHEIADSSVPIMNWNLIQLAADNLFLATEEPELGPAFDGSPTPVNIIAANVYEHLQEHMLDNLETIKEELLEELLEEQNADE